MTDEDAREDAVPDPVREQLRDGNRAWLFAAGAAGAALVLAVLWSTDSDRRVDGADFLVLAVGAAVVTGLWMVLRYTGRQRRYDQGLRLGRRLAQWWHRRRG